jgi:hypothetical protein
MQYPMFNALCIIHRAALHVMLVTLTPVIGRLHAIVVCDMHRRT